MFRAVIRRRLGQRALLALAGALCLRVGLHPSVATVDSNHDGRIDVWEYHDGPYCALTMRVEDTNFDGRPDRYSYRVNGAWRRESDTNFDGHVDEVEQFDTDGNRTRIVRDADHDGTVDLLILYQDGVAVYSQHASPDQFAVNQRAQHGTSLVDPFEHETAVRLVVRKVDPFAKLVSPSKVYTLALCRGSPSLSTAFRTSSVSQLRSQFDPRSIFPRGPPASDFASL